MAFPSSTGSHQQNLSQAWDMARDAAGAIRSRSVSVRDRGQAGTLLAYEVIQLAQTIADSIDLFANAAALPGIVQYAQAQISDPNIDIVAEFTAMNNSAIATRNWIISNFPQDGSGYLLFYKFDANGRILNRTLTTGQVAALVPILDALIATVD
jgi:hypothetical protein